MACLCSIKSSEAWERERPSPTTLDLVRNMWWDNVWANRNMIVDPSMRCLGDLFQEKGIPPNGKTVLVCAGGNSLFNHRDEVVQAVEMYGWDVVTVDKTRLFLIENGIIPTLTLSADADPIVAQWMYKIQPHEKIAFHFQSHPDAIKAASDGGADVYMYSNDLKDGYNVLLNEHGAERFCCVSISCNIGTATIWTAMRMGYSNFVLLGFDYGWPRKSVIDPLFKNTAEYNKGRRWWTIGAYSRGLDAIRMMSKCLELTNKATGTLRQIFNVGGTRMKDGFKKCTFAEAVDLIESYKE